MAVDDIGPKPSKELQVAKHSARNGGCAEYIDAEAFAAEGFAQGAELAVGDDRDTVTISPLQTTELRDQRFSPSHLKTIDNMNDLHELRNRLPLRCESPQGLSPIDSPKPPI